MPLLLKIEKRTGIDPYLLAHIDKEFVFVQVMIRILTLYVVPISFAIILLIGLVGNTLVIFVVSNVIMVAIIGIEVKKVT